MHFRNIRYSLEISNALSENVIPNRSLNDSQIKNLLKQTEKYREIKMRVLLALATGLRRGDIETLKISEIDFKKNWICITNRKTKKCMASRPVSGEVMSELFKYVCSLNVGHEKLFSTKFGYHKWHKICTQIDLADLKFHDLRKTFCSLPAQNGVSTAVTQRLLKHSSPKLTNRIYTNVDSALRKVVEKLIVNRWL